MKILWDPSNTRIVSTFCIVDDDDSIEDVTIRGFVFVTWGQWDKSLASDWSRVITWHRHWRLIGWGSHRAKNGPNYSPVFLGHGDMETCSVASIIRVISGQSCRYKPFCQDQKKKITNVYRRCLIRVIHVLHTFFCYEKLSYLTFLFNWVFINEPSYEVVAVLIMLTVMSVAELNVISARSWAPSDNFDGR